jgi:hypothetical protein
MLALGRVQEGVDRLRDDFQDEKRSAHESRAVIHRRLDDQTEDIAGLRSDVGIGAQVNAQTREEVKALKEIVNDNQSKVQPSIEEWKRIKTMGIGLAGLLALAGLSFGAILMWMSDAAVSAIRHWLRIS